jgi:hypothetical protein
MSLNSLLNASEAAGSAFFFNKKHLIVLIGGIVHRNNQIPFLIRYPFMRAAILMNHHPR